MTENILLAHEVGGGVGSWTPVLAPLVLFGVIVGALLVAGRADRRGVAGALQRIPNALERLTGIPGWAVATVGTASFALILAGIGFYADVAWHVGLGRDEVLFTPPHTAIVLGLGLIAASAAVGVLFASLAQLSTRLRAGPVRIPYSTLPMGALGIGALAGFPLDELWHLRFGIDVTMWSPTHLLMIVGASLSPIASWLVLAEAGTSPRDGGWARGAHVLVGWLTLLGLSSVQGEFAFGVPQFQHLYHPVLVSLAAGFALVTMRVVLGPVWAIGIAVAALVFEISSIFDAGSELVDARSTGLYVVSALVVEAAAVAVGTRNRLRFATLAGLGVGTIGLASEWLWNQRAFQPWRLEMLPDAVVFSTAVAVGAAILGALLASVVSRREGARIPPVAVIVAAALVLVSLAWPLPRRVGDVQGTLEVSRAATGMVNVAVTLDPADAARDARWFQALAWQGGGLVAAEMRPAGDGRYVAEEPVPVTGNWKALVRLHRGAEMMTLPIRFPEDPEINEPAIRAQDRTVAFQPEQGYLMREFESAVGPFAIGISGTVLLLAALWMIAFGYAGTRVRRERDERGGEAPGPSRGRRPEPLRARGG